MAEEDEIKKFREHNRLTRLEAQSAEQKLEVWLLKYPELRLKWVAVRDGEPVCPGDSPYAVRDAYEAKYNEKPRYMILIGTKEERTVDVPILRAFEE